MVKQRNTFRSTAPLGKVDILYYETVSNYSSLGMLTGETVVPFFLHVLFYLSGQTAASLNSTFQGKRFIGIPTPPELLTLHSTIAIPFLFCFICSMIPRNLTESAKKFQENRHIGLTDALMYVNVWTSVGDHTMQDEAVLTLKNFMDLNSDLLNLTFETFLGLCNPDSRTVVFEYAIQLCGQLEYSNMTGVKFIEDYIIGPNHACLVDSTVLSYIRVYEQFKTSMNVEYGANWVYAGVLDKYTTICFTRTDAYKKLYIIAALFGSEVDTNVASNMIGGKSISAFKKEPFFGAIWTTYSSAQQERNQRASEFFDKEDVADVKSKAEKWKTGNARKVAKHF